MADYNFRSIEQKWQQYWKEKEVYKTSIDLSKPKYYALDMFPYPSGAGLHVGHPLGYIASDIVSRYKHLKGYNVLHPMGFDAFGLPAEQYAIDTGQHPAITTENNIRRYKEQLENIGFSFDWDKEVQTSDPGYYKWTQWIFLQLFHSWYNLKTDKAEPIASLIQQFEQEGNNQIKAACHEDTPTFTAEAWKQMSEKEQQKILLKYRLTYLDDTVVNWCPALGTVLANDEVKDGFSERGGYPVERKKMKQWMMRITAYADRLLEGLDRTGVDALDWTESLKEMQRNWIGKSYGCELDFKVKNRDIVLTAFTTRPDTIFGVTYLTLAPEHELIDKLTTPEQKEAVESYVQVAKNRSERERMADVKTVSGVFTGRYAINPISQEEVPIWVADYVLAGYGTGVVMGVPSSDDRDYRFAQHFQLPVVMVIEGTEELPDPTVKKHGTMINSGFINGMESIDAIQAVNEKAETLGVGKPKVNYKMRDAVFSRQRYWGEPVPVYFKDDIPYPLNEAELPLRLPTIDEYKPTASGEPPLARATDWKYEGQYAYELTTMPGWAGSSWYHFRYMDAHNGEAFVSKEAQTYWENVDLYIGGTEHATGHLLYSRFWTKFLYDRGYVTVDEPYKKLINQGMIQGTSQYITRLQGYWGDLKEFSGEEREGLANQNFDRSFLSIDFNGSVKRIDFLSSTKNIFISQDALKYFNQRPKDKSKQIDLQSIFIWDETRPVPIEYVDDRNQDTPKMDIYKYIDEWRPEFKDAVFICEGGFWQNGQFQKFNFVEGSEDFKTKPIIEKMSKSKYNIVNPDDMIEQYGADTLRMYEMFLGPLEQFKPWNTNGIDGVFKFLRKLWRLFHNEQDKFVVSEGEPSIDALKVIHRTIKKAQDDIENYSFNTSVSSFMICVNELTAMKCNNRKILTDLVLIISPYAPHIAEELWHMLGHKESIVHAKFPDYDGKYLIEEEYEYPVSVNGKMRAKMKFALDMPKEDIEKQVLASEQIQKWTEGKTPKRVIIVPKKIVNIVI